MPLGSVGPRQGCERLWTSGAKSPRNPHEVPFSFTCDHTARIVDSSYLIRHNENETLLEELLRAKQDDDIETIARLLFSKGATVRNRLLDRESHIAALNTRIQTMRTLFPNIKVA